MFTKTKERSIKMKQKILALIMWMLISAKLLAQKPFDITLYAFNREVSGGAMQSTDSNPHGNKKPFYHYFIYVETKAGKAPVISSVYLNGDYYSAQVQKVKTPVVISTPEEEEIKHILVKQTKNPVYQIIVTRDNTNLPSAPTIKRQADTNEVLIKGILAGKSFTLMQKKIKKLPTVFP